MKSSHIPLMNKDLVRYASLVYGFLHFTLRIYHFFISEKYKCYRSFYNLILIIAFTFACNTLTISSSYSFNDKILAKVGNKIITSYEFNARIDLIRITNGIEFDKLRPDEREKLHYQILNMLIDENVAKLEAEKLGIEIKGKDVESAIDLIAQDNGLKTEQFVSVLENNNVNIEDFRQQVKSQLLWAEMVKTQVRPKILISDLEILENKNLLLTMQELEKNRLEETMKAYRREVSKPTIDDRVELAEIVLPLDYKVNDKDIHYILEYIFTQLASGVRFNELAKKYSIETSSSDNAGSIGWIAVKDLSNPYVDIITQLNIGQIGQPMQIGDKIIILQLVNYQESPKSKKERLINENKMLERLTINKKDNANPELEIKNLLYDIKLGLYLSRYLTKIKQNYMIELNI